MAEFRMPSLGADMDEGTLLEWLIKPGDEVRKGDVIAVVDTAKSAIDVESFFTGAVDRLVVDVGQTVPVGTVLAIITETAAEKAPPAMPAAPPAAPPAPAAQPVVTAAPIAPSVSPPVRHRAHQLGVDLATVRGTGRRGAITSADVERAAAEQAPEPLRSAPATTAPEPGHAASPQRAGPRARISPRARAIAAEVGVDPASLTGTGPDGAVREADVRRAAAGREPVRPAPAPATAIRPSADRAESMRQAIARLMARSKREIPHYYVSNTADMTRALAWVHDRNRELAVSERLVPAALLVKAAALAARQSPQLNGYWVDDKFCPADMVNLGLAISLRGGGLLTPAIHDAASLGLTELMARMRDLVTRARSGRLRGSELTEGTITVTNLGDNGVESVFGVIYPPQVALVGIGKIIERPVAAGGLVGARPTVITTLAADHRATDGYSGARYLTAISDLLQRPEEL